MEPDSDGGVRDDQIVGGGENGSIVWQSRGKVPVVIGWGSITCLLGCG